MTGVFDALPDPFAGDLGATVSMLVDEALAATPEVEGTWTTHPLPSPTASAVGPWGESTFRRALLALLVADWAVYAEPFERADFARLAYFATRYPRGFRVATWQAGDEAAAVVGYTAHYPIDEATLARLRDGDATLLDRVVVPATVALPGGPTLLFSYGLAPAFRRPPFSRALLREYQASFERDRPGALVALVVSDDGARVAERWGLREVAKLAGEAGEERVFLREP